MGIEGIQKDPGKEAIARIRRGQSGEEPFTEDEKRRTHADADTFGLDKNAVPREKPLPEDDDALLGLNNEKRAELSDLLDQINPPNRWAKKLAKQTKRSAYGSEKRAQNDE